MCEILVLYIEVSVRISFQGITSSRKFRDLKILLCMCRLERELEAGGSLSSRILIITGSDNECDKYVRFMNIIFTAQKQVLKRIFSSGNEESNGKCL